MEKFKKIWCVCPVSFRYRIEMLKRCVFKDKDWEGCNIIELLNFP